MSEKHFVKEIKTLITKVNKPNGINNFCDEFVSIVKKEQSVLGERANEIVADLESVVFLVKKLNKQHTYTISEVEMNLIIKVMSSIEFFGMSGSQKLLDNSTFFHQLLKKVILTQIELLVKSCHQVDRSLKINGYDQATDTWDISGLDSQVPKDSQNMLYVFLKYNQYIHSK